MYASIRSDVFTPRYSNFSGNASSFCVFVGTRLETTSDRCINYFASGPVSCSYMRVYVFKKTNTCRVNLSHTHARAAGPQVHCRGNVFYYFFFFLIRRRRYYNPGCYGYINYARVYKLLLLHVCIISFVFYVYTYECTLFIRRCYNIFTHGMLDDIMNITYIVYSIQ